MYWSALPGWHSLFRNAAFLYRQIHTRHCQCILRNHVRFQQYGCHHLGRHRVTSSWNTVLAQYDTVDWRLGNHHVHHCSASHLRSQWLQVFAAEASGPTHDKVHPRIGITAKWIWSIYAGITALLVGLLMLGGMDWFDSICHAFATTGTGGFSTKQASVAYYNSPYIEYVISIFMFISGINFTLLLLFVNRKFKKFIDNAELKWYFWSVVVFTAVIAVVLYYTSPMGAEEAFRKSLFQVISLHTSTGFATDDYMQWTPVLWGLLTIVMVMGACAGSTTGGLKCIRMVILTKVSRNEFKHILHPNAVLPVRVNKQVISPSIVSTVLAFCFYISSS